MELTFTPAVTAKLANMNAYDNQHSEGGPAHTRDQNKPNRVSIPEAEKMLNVGKRTVADIRKVQRDGIPELKQAVDAGEIKAKPAEAIAKSSRIVFAGLLR